MRLSELEGESYMDFHGKTAIVTGGGTGIGRAASILLAERGANVAVVYSQSAAEAEKTVHEIEAGGGHAVAIRADVSSDEEVRVMVRRTAELYGGIDFLVNNAGITHHIPFSDLEGATDEVWDRLMAVNVKGSFHCARAAAPYLKRAGGAIVNVGSIAGTTGLGSSLPYAVSKAAVHGLTKSLAHALAPDIRVNAVVPGAVETRWWEGREAQMRKLAPNLPLGRIATPAQIADMIAVLLAQVTMTGQLVTVDAGQTM